MGNFDGKTVVVTGAGLGIGFALCKSFASEGAVVALNDMDGALAERAANTINEAIGVARVHPYMLDVANVPAVRVMIEDFASKTGRMDIVIANAGITNYGEFLEYTPEAFDRLTGVNLRGTYFTAQAAAKAMIAQQIPGRIILISSVTGVQAIHNLSAYGITKAGIRHMAATLGYELGKYGITVNAVVPGAVLTERTLADDPNYEENWASVTPTGRGGHIEDIVAAARFLASPEARHVNGHSLVVDGGWTIYSPMPSGHPDKPAASSQLR